MTTTTATTTANSSERFPRYCYTCTMGMWEGYLCEDNSTAFCTLECAALGLHHHPFGPSAMTVEELQTALDVWADSDYRDDVEPPIYWTDWLDIPVSDYDDSPQEAQTMAEMAAENLAEAEAEIARWQRIRDTRQAEYAQAIEASHWWTLPRYTGVDATPTR